MRLGEIRFAAWVIAPYFVVGCSKTVVGSFDQQPAGMTAIAGNNQTGTPGQALPIPPIVRVLSSDAQPVKDVTVVFSAGSGGTVTDGVVRTDVNGVAAAGKWVLGPSPGQQTLSAAVPGVVTVTFIATAVGTPPVIPNRLLVDFRPYGLTTSPTGAIYTSQLDGRSVTRAQVGATTASGVVAVGNTPTDVTFNPSGTLALVSNQFDPSVGIVDVATSRQVAVIPASSTTFRVLVAPDGQRGYATETGGGLLVINLATRTLQTIVPIPTDANGLALGAGDTLLYVSSMHGALATVNLKTLTVVRNFFLGGVLQDVAVSPDGSTLYVAHEDGSGSIDVVNATTGAVTSPIATSGSVFGLKLAADGRSLYATQPSRGSVLVVDRTNGQLLRTFSVGGMPRRLAFDRTTGRALVSNEFGWIDYLPLP